MNPHVQKSWPSAFVCSWWADTNKERTFENIYWKYSRLPWQLHTRLSVSFDHSKYFVIRLDLCLHIHHCKMSFHLPYIHGDRSRRRWIHLLSCKKQVCDKNHKCQRGCMGPSDWRAMLWRHEEQDTKCVCTSWNHGTDSPEYFMMPLLLISPHAVPVKMFSLSLTALTCHPWKKCW